MRSVTMMPDLVVEQLSEGQVRRAFALMRLAMPELTPQAWLQFARPAASGGGAVPRKGILVVRRHAQPHLCGAVCYRREKDLRAGSVLIAEYFVAVDLFHPGVVLERLLDGLERTASGLGCREVRSYVETAAPHLAEHFRAVGQATRGIVFSR
jgi:hypothetical protein